MPPPSGSARATSQTSTAACRRWRGWSDPAAGSSCSRSPPRAGRRCRRSSGFGSTAWSRRSAGWSDSQAYSYLPSSVKRFPGPEELAARMWALRAARDPLRADRRGHHRPTRGNGPDLMATGAQAVVDAGGEELTRIMDRVEQRMAELAAGHGAVLARYAGDTISAGGKRLRPLLVCIAAGAPPPETDGLVRAAVAVELVHGATLVHDDVLDGSRASPRSPDGRRHRRARPRDRHRRPAVLARVRRARRRRVGRRGPGPDPGQPRARARRAGAARGRVAAPT